MYEKPNLGKLNILLKKRFNTIKYKLALHFTFTPSKFAGVFACSRFYIFDIFPFNVNVMLNYLLNYSIEKSFHLGTSKRAGVIQICLQTSE